jgi:phosphoglycolate phosphatase
MQTLVGVELAAQALALYRERFGEVGWQENTVYPGIAQTLEKLCASGIELHVATSKPQVYAKQIIDYFGLNPYFGEVFGSELDGTRANKAELLHYALDQTGAGVGSAMIGDRKHDMWGALGNDLRAIGVSYGYGSYEELENAGAEKIVKEHTELLPLFL